MLDCDPIKLSAYADGELEAAEQQRLAEHLAICPQCRAELDELRATAGVFSQLRSAKLTSNERARLHAALDERLYAPIWRIGGAMGLIAASILVIAGTWLAAIPSAQPAQMNTGNLTVAGVNDWQNIALTGFVPVNNPGDQIYLADSHLDEWMLVALNGSQP